MVFIVLQKNSRVSLLCLKQVCEEQENNNSLKESGELNL